MCELIGRVDADPDVLPRTENFGVYYIAFSAMCPTCPPEFLKLTYNCVKVIYLVHKIYIFRYNGYNETYRIKYRVHHHKLKCPPHPTLLGSGVTYVVKYAMILFLVDPIKTLEYFIKLYDC